MKKSRLIVLTGIDGSGKTTQAELLYDTLCRDGVDVVYVWSRWKPFLLRPFIRKWKKKVIKDVKESGYSNSYNRAQERKQKLLHNPFFRWLWLAAFFVDYSFQILIKIRIKLFGKKLIISDRIFYDSIIDQAINLGQRRGVLLNNLNAFWLKILFPQPDKVIYIDCPADIAFSRKDDAPNVQYLQDRRDLYLTLSKQYGWITMDGTLPVEDIASDIKHKIYDAIGLNI